MTHFLEHVRRQIVGYLALFVALSGTAYAAANLPNRSVTGKKIARNTISGVNLKTNAVTARTIRRGAVRGSEVNESSLGTVPSAANSLTLDGNSLAQVRAGIDAATLGGAPRSAFYSAADVDARLPRVAEARSTGEQNFSSGSPLNNRVSVQLVAPRAGFALVIASGNVRPAAAIAAGQCAVEMSVPEIPQPGRIVSFKAGDNTFDYESLVNSWIVPVEAGPTTFTLRLSINPNVSPGCVSTFSSASSSLNAVWLP